jgi:drug/metabolite transporter (DMT)-like permease
MIPSGDHSSRFLLLRRVSSWSEVTSHRPSGSRESLLLDEDDSLLMSSSSSSVEDDLSTPLLPSLEYEEESVTSLLHLSERTKKEWKLWLVFLLLLISGVSNVVLAKLQSLPMYNYPTFLNVYANFMYIIMSFSYILPAVHFGWFHNSIRWRHLKMNKKPFLVMGFLDAIAAAMQVLSSFYLPGTLLVLLPQAAIPISMLAGAVLLEEVFTWQQITGACIVLGGIIAVLLPVWTHHRAPDYTCQVVLEAEEDYCTVCDMEISEDTCLSHVKQGLFADSNSSLPYYYCHWVSKDDSMRNDDALVFVWSLVMVASCIPMVLSSVYKQVALQVQLDPILVNGFVAIFQLLCGIPLAIPAGVSASPSVAPWELPGNWWSATKCLFLQANAIDSGCHPDDCAQAALFVHLGLVSSAVYTVSMMFVLKYGSASLLYLGLTLIVPLGHLLFSVHSPSSMHWSDLVGLITLLAGLILYRFGHDDDEEEEEEMMLPQEDRSIPLLSTDGTANEEATINTTTGTSGAEEEIKESFLEFLREPFSMVGDI